MPYMFHKDSMNLFYTSIALLVGSKGLAIISPYILKRIVDAMTIGTVDFGLAAMGIGIFGAARIGSTVL